MHGVSLDEFKVSTLILGLIALLIAALISYFTLGDITANLVSLIETFVFAVAGINAVNGVATIVNNSKLKVKESVQTTTSTNNYVANEVESNNSVESLEDRSGDDDSDFKI